MIMIYHICNNFSAKREYFKRIKLNYIKKYIYTKYIYKERKQKMRKAIKINQNKRIRKPHTQHNF